MGTADILVLGVLAFFAIKGLLRGFVFEIIGILGIVLAFLCSYMIYVPMLQLAKAIGLTGNTASITAYVVGFLIIYIVVILIGKVIDKALSIIFLGWLNKLGGCAVGLLKGAVLTGFALYAIVSYLPSGSGVVQDIKKSPVASKTMLVVPYVYGVINKLAGDKRINPFE